jgi:glycosyltransferase involved in cell wall biosynthesis
MTPAADLRICLIGPTYPFRGGIAHYTTLLCEGLRSRHFVLFLAYRRQYPRWLFPGRTQLDPSAAHADVQCERIFEPLNPISWVRAAFRIRREHCDLVILNWAHFVLGPAVVSVAGLVHRMTRARVLLVCHNVKQHEARRGEAFFSRMALRAADVLLVHSREDAANARALAPGAEVIQAFLPVFALTASEAAPKEQARRELGLAGDVVLFFGFVRQYKGLRHLLRALARVRQQRDVRLLVVGEFWHDKDEYLSEVEALGLGDAVRIVDDYVPDEALGGYFAAADAVVLPYTSATQSGVVQLSYHFGKPVITTTVGGLPEVVADGESGFLVPPADEARLAEAILRLYEGDTLAALAAGVELKRQGFSWDRLTDIISEAGREGG